jgi:hypothetical protein
MKGRSLARPAATGLAMVHGYEGIFRPMQLPVEPSRLGSGEKPEVSALSLAMTAVVSEGAWPGFASIVLRVATDGYAEAR